MSAAIGPLNYSQDEGYQKPFSDETGALIDQEVRKVIDNAYKRCKELLEEKRDLVQK
jgi:AFG3 family protein